MDPEAPPATIQLSGDLTPRGPWTFLRAALPGGFTPWGWGLLGGWALAMAGPAFSWGLLLQRTAGWSALPSHWGEGITARDIWELWVNGGLRHHPLNSPTVHTLGLGLIIVLWCGWRMQAETASLPGKLGPWLLGTLDTLLVGLLPLVAVAWCVSFFLGWIGHSGLLALGWVSFVGHPLVVMAAVSALNIQWWLLRMGRAAGRGTYGRHLGWHVRMLWDHPVQWTLLVVGGSAARGLLSFLILFVAWRLGGAAAGRVWAFFLLQLGAAALNAWLLGWFLRATALFWQHDLKVRQARADFLESSRVAKALDA